MAGDWTGVTTLGTRSKVGVFRPGTGQWSLDNGNFSFPSCAEDQCLIGFGSPGDLPAALGTTFVKTN